MRKRRWEHDQHGQKHLVEVDKRLKQWWRIAADDKVLFTARYGVKAIGCARSRCLLACRRRPAIIETRQLRGSRCIGFAYEMRLQRIPLVCCQRPA